jgi:hypothetical protein
MGRAGGRNKARYQLCAKKGEAGKGSFGGNPGTLRAKLKPAAPEGQEKIKGRRTIPGRNKKTSAQIR